MDRFFWIFMIFGGLLCPGFGLIASPSKMERNLKHYELMKPYELTHHIVKRGAHPSTHKMNHIKELQFKTLGR